jgi:hypothetical protein
MMIDINDLILNKGYFTKSENFADLVFSNDGSFDLVNESMEFKAPNGEDIFIEYNIHVTGSIDKDGYALVGNQEIVITKIYIGENKVVADYESDIIKLLKSEIY